jgi:hypothetical protein
MMPLSKQRTTAARRLADDRLGPVRMRLAMIRGEADDRIAEEISKLRAFYADLPEHQLAPMIARAARRRREREEREIRELTGGLDRTARIRLFNETLDPRVLGA